MALQILESELILNTDGSVYHLNLLPEDLAPLVILVGDPERVPLVSKYFDTVEMRKHKREFVTHTGFIGAQRITVLSTGIGTDNIDIVLNELDLLTHVDLHSGLIKSDKHDLSLIRIGTSGAVQPNIEVDSILVSEQGLGLDNLLWYYQLEHDADVSYLSKELGLDFIKPYLFNAADELLLKFDATSLRGITATCCGFYGPQGRQLRKAIAQPQLVSKLAAIKINGNSITNFEMETAAIFGMSKLFGFKAIAVNAIVANRATHTFSKNADQTIEKTIKYTLDTLLAST